MAEAIAYVEHPGDVLAAAVDEIDAGRRFALIASTAIEGGAAREVGSLALVRAGGDMVGYLSNGCIDRDIQLHAENALRDGAAKVIRYGKGSDILDLKLPCGGALEILIDPDPDRDALGRAHGDLAARQAATLRFTLPGAEATQVAFTYAPKFRLVLAGRGAVFRATAQVAVSAGFEVFALSPEDDDIEALAPICAAPPVHLTSPVEAPGIDTLDAHSAFLTLFHDHDWEPALLRAALARPTAFVGSLGSRRTHRARVARLAEMGVAPDALARLHGPVGLVPSLREAPLIAISAIAEVTTAMPQGIRRA